MKMLFYILLLLFMSNVDVFGQSYEENAVFEKINAHRDSLGLKKLIWDNATYEMASHHAEYITITNSNPYNLNIIGHNEEIDVPDFEELSFNERCNRFIVKDFSSMKENCIITIFKPKSDKAILINAILEGWVNSKYGHKENLETKDVTRGACSVLYYSVTIELKTNSGLKNVQFFQAITVLNIY